MEGGEGTGGHPTVHSYDVARGVVVAAKLRNVAAWRRWSATERPQGVPGAPNKVYKDRGWRGYDHWLGLDEVEEVVEEAPLLQLGTPGPAHDDGAEAAG
eukprot:CAMPEP_0197613158 /NCGR_PEP_ID=MMETSP1326-20131121/58686_1 /TAXON_ID=1155430 /ORGANISM="Genus nov. species nov., Strain RCC2288" /LENGTH=98 /DNA_ID=CAMNT_0043181997 /DNA_START=202 /DNA_END=495 /DNA_ORIENTATION=+